MYLSTVHVLRRYAALSAEPVVKVLQDEIVVGNESGGILAMAERSLRGTGISSATFELRMWH